MLFRSRPGDRPTAPCAADSAASPILSRFGSFGVQATRSASRRSDSVNGSNAEQAGGETLT